MSAALPVSLHNTAHSGALALLLGTVPAPACAAPSPRAWQLVEQARDRVRQDPATPLTVAELCQALRVSRRTLQNAFQDVLGVPPATFLRAVRLAGARAALRQADTVTEAAAQWGFWHFSHFARDYRRMFGELPSSTWRRLHQGAQADPRCEDAALAALTAAVLPAPLLN